MSLHTPPQAPLAPELVEIARIFSENVDIQALTIDGFRDAYRAAILAEGRPQNPVATRDFTVPTRHGDVPVRLYSPPLAQAAPLLLYIHGGGFVVGDLDCLDVPLHEISRKGGVAILSVGYSRAPESKFPVAIEQCEDVLRHAVRNRETFNVNDRCGVAGDSAGGNMGALLAQRLRGDPEISLRWQCLINPVLDLRGVREERTASLRTYRDGPILHREAMLWFTDKLIRNPDDEIASSPAQVDDLTGLPPAFIATAECDPLRDEGAEYADRLRLAGVSADYVCYPGMFHNFIAYTGRSPTAARMVSDMAAQAQRHLCSS